MKKILTLLASLCMLAGALHAQELANFNFGGRGVQVVSPMPGKILGIKVRVGDAVKKGQVMMILEAMKMENAMS